MGSNIDVPLTVQGLSQATSKQAQPPGTPIVLQNLVYDRVGQLSQRPGMLREAALDYGGARRFRRVNGAVVALHTTDWPSTTACYDAPFEAEVRGEDGVWGDATNRGSFGGIKAIDYPVADIRRQEIDAHTGAYATEYPDCAVAYNGSQILMVRRWSTSSYNWHWQLTDPETGAIISSGVLAISGLRARVFALSSGAWLIVYQNEVGELCAETCTDPSSWTDLGVLLTTDVETDWDGVIDGNYFCVFAKTYITSSYRYAATRFNMASGWSSTQVNFGAAAAAANLRSLAIGRKGFLCSLADNTGQLIIWGINTAYTGTAWAAFIATLPAGIKARKVAIGGTDTTPVVYYSYADDSGVFRKSWTGACIVDFAAGTATAGTVFYGAELVTGVYSMGVGASAATSVITDSMVVALSSGAYADSFQANHAIILYDPALAAYGRDWTTLAMLQPDVSANLMTASTGNYVSHVARLGSSTYPMGAVAVVGEHDLVGTWKTVLYRWSFTSHDCGLGCDSHIPGGVTYSGGSPRQALPERSTMHVPLQYPAITCALGSAGNVTGTTAYKALWVSRDTLGNSGYGPPSLPTSIDATSDVVTVTMSNWASGSYDSPGGSVLEVYRSLNGGPYYYAGAATTGTSMCTFSDNTADYSANRLLYSEGEVERFCPPYSTALAQHKNRLFSASGNRIYFSHELRSGELPQWSDINYVTVPTVVGGLASISDQLLIFGTDPEALWVLMGDGPDRLGNNAYPMPSCMNHTVGLSRRLGGARSVLTVGTSIVFRSSRSIEWLDLGGAPQPIGESVKDILDDYPVVIDVTHCLEERAVYWILGSDDTSGSLTRTVVRFDYANNSWSEQTGAWASEATTITAHRGHVLTGAASRGAIWSNASSGVWKDQTYNGTDAVVTSTIELAPIRPFGANGRGYIRNVQLLGTGKGTTSLTLTMNPDAQSYSSVAAISAATDVILTLNHKNWYPRTTQLGVKIEMAPIVGQQPPQLHTVSFDVDQISVHRRPKSIEKF